MSGVPQPTMRSPLTFSLALDRVSGLVKANFKLFFGIAVIPPSVAMLAYAAVFAVVFIPLLNVPPNQPVPDTVLHIFRTVVPAILAIALIQGVVFSLYLPAACLAAVNADLGIRTTFREAYRQTLRHAGRYILLLLLTYLIAFSPALLVQLAI